MTWDSLVEKVWKDTEGNHEETLLMYEFGGTRQKQKGRTEMRDRLAPRNKVKGEEHFDI